MELIRETADSSSKERDNIQISKHLTLPQKPVLESQFVSETVPDSLGTNSFPNYAEEKPQKLLCTVHATEGYKYLIPYFNLIMKWQR